MIRSADEDMPSFGYQDEHCHPRSLPTEGREVALMTNSTDVKEDLQHDEGGRDEDVASMTRNDTPTG